MSTCRSPLKSFLIKLSHLFIIPKPDVYAHAVCVWRGGWEGVRVSNAFTDFGQYSAGSNVFANLGVIYSECKHLLLL